MRRRRFVMGAVTAVLALSGTAPLAEATASGGAPVIRVARERVRTVSFSAVVLRSSRKGLWLRAGTGKRVFLSARRLARHAPVDRRGGGGRGSGRTNFRRLRPGTVVLVTERITSARRVSITLRVISRPAIGVGRPSGPPTGGAPQPSPPTPAPTTTTTPTTPTPTATTTTTTTATTTTSPAPPPPAHNVITTFAGMNGSNAGGYQGDGGPATSASLADPAGVVIDGSGDVYFSDSSFNMVAKVDAATGTISKIAGTGTPAGGYSGDGGPASSAQLNGPQGLALDSAGDLYIADNINCVVRRIDHTTGIITTVAGTPTSCSSGYTGDGGPATSATLASPWGLVIDGSGNLYVSDASANMVAKVDTTGTITKVAGTGTLTGGYSGDGGPAGSAQLNSPEGLALDSAGDLYIADNINCAARRIDHSTGNITTVAGTPTNCSSSYSGDGGPATSASLDGPSGLTIDGSGDLYISDQYLNMVAKVDTTGTITKVAGTGTVTTGGYSGDGGPANSAQLNSPAGLALDSAGDLYIADNINAVIRKITP